MPTIEIIPDWRHVLIQLISLIFLLFMFKRYAWQPTKAFLNKRQGIVAAQFEEAEALKSEANTLKNTYEQHILEIEEEGQRLIEASKCEGRVAYEKIVAQAQVAAEKNLSKAARAIEQDRKVAHDKIKEEIIDIAMGGVEKIIKKEMDANVHQQLFDSFVDKVREHHGEE